MAGIPIHTESPINVASAAQEKAAMISTPAPASAEPNPTTPAAAQSAVTTTTACTMNATPSNAAPLPVFAQLGSKDVSLPTSTYTIPAATAAASVAISTTMQRPSSTSTTSEPPPPQPGTLPTPYSSMSRSPSPRRDIPPPPKAGEKVQPASYYSPAPTPTYKPAPSNANAYALPPSGMSESRYAVPPPPTSTTTTMANGLLSPSVANSQYAPSAQAAASTGPLRLSLDHPPGYQQNPHAQDMTPDPRFAPHNFATAASSSSSQSPGYYHQSGQSGPAPNYQQHQHQQQTGPGMLGSLANGWGNLNLNLGLGLGGLQSPGAERKGSGSGILNGEGGGDGSSVWETVGGWAKTVGKKAADVEAEVWRRVNGE